MKEREENGEMFGAISAMILPPPGLNRVLVSFSLRLIYGYEENINHWPTNKAWFVMF